jgi:putative Holliday junction resolvase
VRESSRGRRLGVDVGKVRVGVAISDPDGILATPVATVARDLSAEPDKVPGDMVEIVRLMTDHDVVQIIVGLPVQLSGTEGAAAIDIRAYSERLAKAVWPVPIALADERMSTVVATRRLAERGVRGRRQRAVVDQAAAVEILQSWLDAQRRQSR